MKSHLIAAVIGLAGGTIAALAITQLLDIIVGAINA